MAAHMKRSAIVIGAGIPAVTAAFAGIPFQMKGRAASGPR
jgi:hypothetical protein